MNKTNIRGGLMAIGLGLVLSASMTGCVGYVDPGAGGVVVDAPGPIIYGGFGGVYDGGAVVRGYSHRGAVSRGAAHFGGGGHAGGGRR